MALHRQKLHASHSQACSTNAGSASPMCSPAARIAFKGAAGGRVHPRGVRWARLHRRVHRGMARCIILHKSQARAYCAGLRHVGAHDSTYNVLVLKAADTGIEKASSENPKNGWMHAKTIIRRALGPKW